MDGVLSAGEATDFFCDEYRNPVYVHDVVVMVRSLLDLATFQGGTMRHVFNAGGPQRLSRADMARLLAVGRGYDVALIKAVPATSMVLHSLPPPSEQTEGKRSGGGCAEWARGCESFGHFHGDKPRPRNARGATHSLRRCD